MFKRAIVSFVAVVLSTGGTLAVSDAASAEHNCPTGAACMWKDKNWVTNGITTSSVKFYNYMRILTNKYYPGTNPPIDADDSVSSVWNSGTGGEIVWWFKGQRCSGVSFWKEPGDGDGNFDNGDPAGDFDNTISSGAFASQVTTCASG